MVSDELSVEVLREMFRSLQAWRSLYEAEGVDILCGPDGTEWALWDIELLYEMSQDLLSSRQKQAIRYCLYENLSEAKAAAKMGADESNPVTMYASSGLEVLVHLSHIGMLPNSHEFRMDQAKRAKVAYERQAQSFIPSTIGFQVMDVWADAVIASISQLPCVTTQELPSDISVTVIEGTTYAAPEAPPGAFFYDMSAWLPEVQDGVSLTNS